MRARLLPVASSLSLALVVLAPFARAALGIGVVPSTLKVREADTPTTTTSANIKAAKNEFEAFQIVLSSATAVTGVSAKLSASLTGPGGAKIPDANVTLYAERYYDVGTPSNDEGAAGNWPDPLVPDVDVYFSEKRNAFPLDVPAGKTRVIWVDVLVPNDAAPGDYAGEIEIDVGGSKSGAVSVNLHVGTFSLPSTATLGSAYGFGWNTAPTVHCPGTTYPYCGGEDASVAIRTLYVRAALDHRVTLSNTDFQPPFGGSAAPFEKYVLPLIAGTGPTRLVGAKLTTVTLDGSDATVGDWITYAKSKGFFDRLFYYPTDEPGSSSSAWASFVTHSDALHASDPTAQICLTTSIQDANAQGDADKIDIFVPVIDQMYGRPGSGYDGDQRSKYDAWSSAKAGRKIWMYQSCDEHGCGACGTPSPGVDYTGWPERVIDSTGVQDRAFGWVAWQEKVTAELYFATDYQLGTAWDPNGQCAFSGSGDGTIFYPGKTSIIGGADDIPIESIRLKLIRESMEDFEYLVQVEAKNPTLAHSTADGLFPKAYDCHKTPDQLEAARDALFAALDSPVAPGDAGPDASPGDGGGHDGGGTDGGSKDGGGGDGSPVGDSSSGDGGPTTNGANGDESGSCGCETPGARDETFDVALLVVGAASLVLARRRRRAH
jgi:hypothetical protein